MTKEEALFTYLLRRADDTLILGHRLSEWCGHGPILEEDIALTNLSLDLIGQCTSYFQYAAQIEGKGRTEDDLAFLRIEKDYVNCLMVEQPNGDFGKTITRQFFYDVYHKLLLEALVNSKDEQLSAIAEKSLKEVKYHLRHSSEWMIRLGDGTEESHERMQNAVDDISRFIDELFYKDQVDEMLIKEGIIPDSADFRAAYDAYVTEVLEEATLQLPEKMWQLSGGRKGVHSEHLGYLLAELQYMQRTYPNMEW
ncbi:MAG: phenylacetate-CoA oxygenase subunit PaaC [Crocinitomicaceae bacterium]|nr:phenylacetate-CoA oxygenase subunit PaaC [Crocinitomicaceae bacterium]